ncbi:MAG TPA: VOC family protein [Rhizomicrobium sp.]|nr:VOC family protein [Rhizomicrobium sp.]
MTGPLLRGPLASLGEIMQLAFVPADFDGALRFWIETMGAGPFFALDHVQVENVRYRGKPANIDFSMMLGYWGDMQIEIIRQHNDTPSIYSTWRKEGREGLHHMCVLVDDIALARKACADVKAERLQEGTVPNGGAFFYADTGGGPGTMLEVLKPGPGSREFFAMMRDAARGWDGKDPIRKLG